MTEKQTNQAAPLSAGRAAAADVASLLRARNPLIWITTREEARVERLLFEAAASVKYEVRFWDCAAGITSFDGEAINARATDPTLAMNDVKETTSRVVFVFRDLHRWMTDPVTLRMLRNLSRSLELAKRDEARSVIILSPSSEIPPEIAAHAIVKEWPLPDRAEIAELLDASIANLPDEVRKDAAPNGSRDLAIDAAVGLSAGEAQATFAKSLVSTRRIDAAAVASEKKRVIAREKVLEWVDPLQGGLDSVGGLEALKEWLALRNVARSARAREYGLPAPKGALLVGVPGCGKSLTAKAIATAWQMPLLRLDLGALKSKWVGESEANIRKALTVAETIAPCVLWLDEIEKALAGAGSGAADGGVSTDALGAVLTWLQERQSAVFMVATANDVSALPPELLRKGRFDEIFFVDLPTKRERCEILRASLRAFNRDVEKLGNVDAMMVADACEGFTGAEIAALVPDALFRAFNDGEREVTGADLVACAEATSPLSKTASEKISKVREWAKGRARPATMPEKLQAVGSGRSLDI